MANKALKTGILLCLSAIGLTACSSSDVIAKPSDYSNPVVTDSTGGDLDVYKNIMSDIYDSIREGDLPSRVLDKVLYSYSISVIGRYDRYCNKDTLGEGEITLTEAVNEGKMAEFLAQHESYENEEEVKAKLKSIEKRIAEAMYDKISSGSYSYRNKFYEQRFLRSLAQDLKKVNAAGEFYAPQLLLPSVDKEDVFDNFLHRANYQDPANGITYIEDEIIPDIYRQLLVEEYVINESYGSLGKSDARKINVIAISDNYDKNTETIKLVNYLTDPHQDYSFLRAPDSTTGKTEDSTNKVSLDDFKVINNLWNGVFDLEDAQHNKTPEAEIVEDLGFESDTFVVGGENVTAYKGTEFYEVLNDYSEIYTDLDKWNDFTSNGTYAPEVGFDIKRDEVALKDHITDGWFTENNNKPSIGSLTDNLFKLSVSVGLDLGEENDRYQWDGTKWELFGSEKDGSDYVARINGSFFLKNPTGAAGTDNSDILFYDSGTYYICQIEQAVRSQKLNKSYSQYVYDDATLEETINEVAKIVATGSNYEADAKEHYLKEMALKYFDTEVYDYFKENFPDLFD